MKKLVLALALLASPAMAETVGKAAAKLTVTYVECAGHGGTFYWGEDRAKMDIATNGQASRLFPLVREMYWNTPQAEYARTHPGETFVACQSRIKEDRQTFLDALVQK